LSYAYIVFTSGIIYNFLPRSISLKIKFSAEFCCATLGADSARWGVGRYQLSTYYTVEIIFKII